MLMEEDGTMRFMMLMIPKNRAQCPPLKL